LAAQFLNALEKHHGIAPDGLVDAGVFRPAAGGAGRFEYATVRLDPGDLQLM
jgi:hypothetical protein